MSSDSATLQALTNQGGSQPTYNFEYGKILPYEASVPAVEALGVSGHAVVEAHVQDLSPDTLYHFRAVAISGKIIVDGLDDTFTTQPSGGERTPPDSRTWELVSPPDKHGAGIEPIGFSALQASEGGNAITYEANGAIAPNPPGNLLEDTQVFSQRGLAGWASEDITTPRNEVTASISTGEYQLFSSNLSLGLVEPLGNTALSSEVLGQAVYLRDNPTASYRGVADSAEFPGAIVHVSGATPDLATLLCRSVRTSTSGLRDD